MDPSILLTGMLKALDLVHKWREGALNQQEAKELYARVFSSLLWEAHDNLHRCETIMTMAEKQTISAGILSFFVRDALFSEFCVMCPEPGVVSTLNEIYGSFERIHHWQRVTTDLHSDAAKFIVGFASDLFKQKKTHSVYNDLRKALVSLEIDVPVPPEFVWKDRSN